MNPNCAHLPLQVEVEGTGENEKFFISETERAKILDSEYHRHPNKSKNKKGTKRNRTESEDPPAKKARVESSSKPLRLVNLVIGANYGVGHGMRCIMLVNSSLNIDELSEAYKRGERKLGFNFQFAVAHKPNDCALSREQHDQLVKAGIPMQDLNGDVLEQYGSEYGLTPVSYLHIWLHIAKLGDPTLDWEMAKLPQLHIGGYGLYEEPK